MDLARSPHRSRLRLDGRIDSLETSLSTRLDGVNGRLDAMNARLDAHISAHRPAG